MEPSKKINVLVGVTASVAAVKTPELIDGLFESGRVGRIDLIVTESAKHFLKSVNYKGKPVFDSLRAVREKHTCASDPVRESDREQFGDEGFFGEIGTRAPLSKLRVFTDADEWKNYKDVNLDPVLHIELAKRNDVLLISPLSAGSLSKIVNGSCDNLVTTTVRAWPFDLATTDDDGNSSTKPFFVAPAMNTVMWNQGITQQHVGVLKTRGVAMIDPVVKLLACGDTGKGAMADVETIVARATGPVTPTVQTPPPSPGVRMVDLSPNSKANAPYDGSQKAFFEMNSAPPDLSTVSRKVSLFLEKIPTNKTVVLVTSGGTTVRLERNTVRSIDNFSTGGRGSASCEHFLRRGCCVIFLHRRFSILPFQRNCRPLFEELDDSLESFPDKIMSAATECRTRISLCAQENEDIRLLSVPFSSVVEYLFYMRCIVTQLDPLGKRAMLYLAAAVSDFYIPEVEMARDKIQSTPEGLTLQLRAVPKMLAMVRSSWAPNIFFVSFKLETESHNFLLMKAKRAMEKYGVDVVVANMLQNYKKEVTLITRKSESLRQVSDAEGMILTKVQVVLNPNLPDRDLEQDIVSVVLQQQAHTLDPLKHTAMDAYPVFNGYPYLTVYRVEDL